MAIITLTTDFGADSPYVAQMKGAILRNSPAATIVDITHSIPPQDVLAGAVVLTDSVFEFPAGTLHVAVVDPGVGSERIIVAAKINGHWFVAPDNGLLTGVALDHSFEELRSVTNQSLWRLNVSNTFHGRDIMAPVAALLAMGIAAEKVGPTLDGISTLPWPQPTIQTGQLRGEVLLADSFGNLITNITQADVQRFSPAGEVTVQCGGRLVGELVKSYAARPPGEAVALFGSAGRLEIAVVNGSAARQLGVARKTAVVLRATAANP